VAVVGGVVLVGAVLATERVVRVAWTTDPLVGPAVVAALLAGASAWLLPRAASVVEQWILNATKDSDSYPTILSPMRE
jgi:hypothetical protein